MATKKYLLKLNTGLFLWAISEQGQHSIATVFYYLKSGVWSEDTLKTQWNVKHFLDDNHEKVYASALVWVSDELGTPREVEEI